jgi:hypothetical protein
MINSNKELEVTQERIERLQRLLATLRRTARPEEFEAVTSGYRQAIERMQAEVLDYLLSPLSFEPEAQAE